MQQSQRKRRPAPSPKRADAGDASEETIRNEREQRESSVMTRTFATPPGGKAEGECPGLNHTNTKCHSRKGGYPLTPAPRAVPDSRFRGNDGRGTEPALRPMSLMIPKFAREPSSELRPDSGIGTFGQRRSAGDRCASAQCLAERLSWLTISAAAEAHTAASCDR